MATFATLSDEALTERLAVLLASCERIMALPAADRCKSRKSGHVASPQEFGAIQATLALSAWNEARRRGLVPDEEL